MLEQGIPTLFRKPADWEDGQWVFQRTVYPEIEFYTKRGGGMARCEHFFLLESFVLAAVHIGPVTMFLYISKKPKVILHSVTFKPLYE